MGDNMPDSKGVSCRQPGDYGANQSTSYDDRTPRNYIQTQPILSHPDHGHRRFMNQSHAMLNPLTPPLGSERQHVQRQLTGISETGGAPEAYMSQIPFNAVDLNYRYNYLGISNKPATAEGFSLYSSSDVQNTPTIVRQTAKVAESRESGLIDCPIVSVSNIHQSELNAQPMASDILRTGLEPQPMVTQTCICQAGLDTGQMAAEVHKVRCDVNQTTAKATQQNYLATGQVHKEISDNVLSTSNLTIIEEQKRKIKDRYDGKETYQSTGNNVDSPPPLIPVSSDVNGMSNINKNSKLFTYSQTVSIDHVCEKVAKLPEDEVYKCGGCAKEFQTICSLHVHLKSHDSRGSYYYSHQTKTAFPKFDTMCKETQTAKCESSQIPTQRKKSFEQAKKNKAFSKASVAENITYDTDIEIKCEHIEILPSSNSGDSQTKIDAQDSTYIPLRTGDASADIKDEIEMTEHAEMKYSDDAECDTDSYEAEGGLVEMAMANSRVLKKSKKKRKKSITDRATRSLKKRKADQITDSVNGEKKSKIGINLKIEKKYTCQLCDKGFSKKAALNYHMMKAHGDSSVLQPKECRWCGDTFSTGKDLNIHSKTCDKNDTRKCFICDQNFPSRPDMLKHLLTHRNPEDLKCKLCSKVFHCEIRMRSHVKRHTQPKNIQCDKCGKAFYYRNLLNKHLVYCNDEKPVQCQHCHVRFKTKDALKHHSSVHTEEKPYVCHICGYAGKKLMYLKRHIRSHTGEKPYACKVCDMRFSALNGLNRHNKVHTNSKPCVCKYCGKSFTNNWNLKTHERQHTGDTPYKCEHCGMGFKQNVLVKLHMKSHHPYM